MKLVSFEQKDSRLTIELDISGEGLQDVSAAGFIEHELEVSPESFEPHLTWLFSLWGTPKSE